MAVINPPERKLAKRTSVHCTETFQVVNRTYNAEQFHKKVDKVVTYGLDFFYLFAMIGSNVNWKCPREVEREKKLDKKHTPSPWLTRIWLTRISLTRIFKRFPFLT